MQREWVLAAERHSTQLPPRLKSMVEFHRAYLENHRKRAREIVEALIAKDSTDVEAWYQLGEAHFHDNPGYFPHADSMGNVGRALRAFQRALALDSTYTLAGAVGSAGLWRGLVLFEQNRPAQAAATFDSALRAESDTLTAALAIQNSTMPSAVLGGAGGRVDAAMKLNRTLFRLVPFDTGTGPGGIRLSKADLVRLSDGAVYAEIGAPEAGAWAREIQSTIARSTRGDTAERRRLTTSFGTMYLAAYLATRDTSLLATFMARVDTTNSATWHVADAHLALARRDTARARMRVAKHYEQPTPAELTGEAGTIRAYAWGDLLNHLGEPRAAIGAFAKLDSTVQRVQHAGFVVRSYAERGGLYHQLGERDAAIAFYEKFITAWQGADPKLQPAVDRARQALEAVKPGARPTPPGR